MNLDAANTINSVVRSILPTGSGPTKGVRVVLSYTVSDHTDEDPDVWSSESISLLFRCENNYMTVWVAYSRNPKCEDYKFIGYHDSGWRAVVGIEVRDLETRVKREFEKSFGKRANASPRAVLEDVDVVQLVAHDKIVSSLS